MGSSCSFFKRWRKDNNKIDEDLKSSSNTGQDNPAFTENLDTQTCTVSEPSEITVEINTNPVECGQAEKGDNSPVQVENYIADNSEVLLEVNSNSTECIQEEEKEEEEEDEEEEEELEKEEENDTATFEQNHLNRQNEEEWDNTTLKRDHVNPLTAKYMDRRDIPYTQCDHSLNSSGAYSGYGTGGRISEETDYKSNDNSSNITDRPVGIVPKTFMSDVAEQLKHYNEEPYNEATGRNRCIKVYIQEDNAKQQKLIRNYSYLRENIYTEELCDRLIEECIIDIEEKQRILNETSAEGKADVLLQTLLQKPTFESSDIFERFIEVLIPAHSFVVDRLNSTEPFQAIVETDQTDKEFPYARSCLEERMDRLAEQVDVKTVTLICFERSGISLVDYLEIYPKFNRRKEAAKTFLQSVMKGCNKSLYVFINVLKDLNCDSTLDILKNFRPQAKYIKEPDITVTCQNNEVNITGLQEIPKGYKIVINMNSDEIVQQLNSSSRITECVLKNVHCEIVKATSGSVVILLKAHDDSLLQQLQTSEKDYSFLCNLLKEVFRGCVQDHLRAGGLQITLTVEEEKNLNFIDNADEHSRSSHEKIQNRKTFICKELDSNKYTKAFQDQGCVIVQQQSKDLSRLGKMRSLMNIVMQDETTCDKFIEIVNRLESPITCERILWNGNKNQIIKGMLENIEYLLDELIPSHILQHMNPDILKEADRREILVSETKDRRESVIVLLKRVFNGNAKLVCRFYDALLEAGNVDVADQVRVSGQTQKDIIKFKGTQYQSEQIRETGQCEHRYLFKGEFRVCIEEAVHCDRWETNIMSMILKSPTSMAFHLKPLHDNMEAMIEIDVEFKDKAETTIKCVNKATIKDKEVVNLEVSTYHKCTITTTFTTSDTSIQRTGGRLNIKSRNLSLRIETYLPIDPTEMTRLGPETYTGHNTAMANRPVSYAGAWLASSPRARNSLERIVHTYGNTGAEGNDIDKGYHSTEPSRVSSANEVYPRPRIIRPSIKRSSSEDS